MRSRDSPLPFQPFCLISSMIPFLFSGFKLLLPLTSLLPQNLSPSQRPLCVIGRLGRKKKKARGARWEGGREEKSFPFSLFPSSSARVLFFDYCYFHWDTQRETLQRRELQNHRRGKTRKDSIVTRGRMALHYFALANSRPINSVKPSMKKLFAFCLNFCIIQNFVNSWWLVTGKSPLHIVSRFLSMENDNKSSVVAVYEC